MPISLCSALQNRYRSEGLKCEYRRFDSIEQLRKAGVTLVVIKETFLVDHCIAVLEVQDNTVAIADPITGAQLMPIERFERIWRFTGIVLERNSTKSARPAYFPILERSQAVSL